MIAHLVSYCTVKKSSFTLLDSILNELATNVSQISRSLEASMQYDFSRVALFQVRNHVAQSF